MKKFAAPLALMVLFCFSASASEVSSARGNVITSPVHRNLRVQSVSLVPGQSASVRLNQASGNVIVIPGEGVDPLRESKKHPGCDGNGCCPGTGCDSSGITVALDLKDAGDRDLYATFLQAQAQAMRIMLVTKAGQIAQVELSSSYAVHAY